MKMKKTYVEVSGAEKKTLFADIAAVYGGWLCEWCGVPYCLNELEEAQNEESYKEIKEIEEIISDPATYWEECSKEDVEYINDTLYAWGICG